ncbi:hypothetical protein BCR42DRAFT_405292 [Absidia repens]|uniref:Uncharacterized protein n=1 Tax=Absidia repens TaxID=90262 RepID=A0A1X2IT70_9FUNG|nr:hypothetical protein BCR42DRAFT_405292 [Absidia repens]
MVDKSQNASGAPTEQKKYSKWRRGSQMASERDMNGIRSRTSTGFSTAAARFDDTWGNNAFTETGFTEVGYSETVNNNDDTTLKDTLKDSDALKNSNVGK